MSCTGKKEKYEQLYRKADKDNNGRLTLGELEELIIANDPDQSPEKIKSYLAGSDLSGDGVLSEREFLYAMGVVDVDQDEIMMQIFRGFDVDGSGFINVCDLEKMFEGKGYTRGQLERMKDEMDIDEDGKVDYNEFKKRFFGGGQ